MIISISQLLQHVVMFTQTSIICSEDYHSLSLNKRLTVSLCVWCLISIPQPEFGIMYKWLFCFIRLVGLHFPLHFDLAKSTKKWSLRLHEMAKNASKFEMLKRIVRFYGLSWFVSYISSISTYTFSDRRTLKLFKVKCNPTNRSKKTFAQR